MSAEGDDDSLPFNPGGYGWWKKRSLQRESDRKRKKAVGRSRNGTRRERNRNPRMKP